MESDLFFPALETLAQKNEIRIWEDRLYLTRLYEAEKGISDRINALLSFPESEPDMDREEILEQVLSGLAVELSDEQLDVVCQVMSKKYP